MDFWVQHKDFVLKVLAGLGVFLVALIARGIVYGDDLQTEQKKNRGWVSEVKAMQIADPGLIRGLEDDRDKRIANANTIIDQIGWKGTAEELELKLIERVLGYLRRYRQDPGQIARGARASREAILANPSSGFGTLRGQVDDELGDEASERNIRVDDGFGFQNVTEMKAEEVEKYLLQLELVTRAMRYCIDQGSDMKVIEEIRIETKDHPAVPGANPEFIREYAVRITFKSTLKAAVEVLRRLREAKPSVPLRSVRMDRLIRPRDLVLVEFTVLATAATLDAEKVPFMVKEGQ